MLTVKRVILQNVKSFTDEATFDFENAKAINTISGINGSGKSTLFKAIAAAQRAFFAAQTDRIDVKERVTTDLLGLLNQQGSFIAITFSVTIGEEVYEAAFKLICTERTAEEVSWKIDATDEAQIAIRAHWNIDKPTDIIVYIDSARFISEADFSSREISMSRSKSIDDLISDYIFFPEQLFETIYARIISDYARNRISPNKPRWDMPHVAAKILLRSLLSYLDVSNFTPLAREGQFVLQVRRNQNTRAGHYDVRSLSSGEKTLFYILHFICYVKNISLLVIDEPENNLHENMLSEFVSLLERICTTKDFGKLLVDVAKQTKVALGVNAGKQLKGLYKSHQLSSVYLLTHSRSLIYNVFNVGSNFYVEEGLKALEYDEAEQVMRSIGLSKIYDRVLFVEGDTDVSFIEAIVAPYNVKVKPLGGCPQVISAYRNYLKLKSHVRETQFCFMIDRDTRSDASIDDIRSEDTASFDKHFVVLERHELENYFLDAALFREVFKRIKAVTDMFPSEPPEESEIDVRLRTIADESRPQLLLQTIQHLNSHSLGGLLEKLNSRDVPLSNNSDYEDYITSSLTDVSTSPMAKALKDNYRKAKTEFAQWNTKWKSLCDGKRTLRVYTGEVAALLGTTPSMVERTMTKAALETKTVDAHTVVMDIVSRFGHSST